MKTRIMSTDIKTHRNRVFKTNDMKTYRNIQKHNCQDH